MIEMSLSYRIESESNTHDTDTNSTDSVHNLSNDSSVETTKENSTTTVTVEELRNYDTQPSTTIEFINFESLELKIDKLIEIEQFNQNQINKLNYTSSQNFIVNYTLMFIVIFLAVMLVIYKFISDILYH